MKRNFTCIVCPNGCEITAETDESGKVLSVAGEGCPRGKTYAEQELTDPRRTIASSIPVRGGTLPLASVRLTKAIPKDRIFDAMAELRRLSADAPVKSGTVVLRNLFGTGADVMVTKDIPAAK